MTSRWARVVIAAVLLVVAGAAGAQTLADDLAAYRRMEMERRERAVGVVPTGDTWTNHHRVHRASWGPVLRSFGLDLGAVAGRSGGLRAAWWVVMLVTTTLGVAAVWNRVVQGEVEPRGTVFFPIVIRVLLGAFIGLQPAFLYASCMTVKDGLAAVIAEAGGGPDAGEFAQRGRMAGPLAARVGTAVLSAVQDAYEQRAHFLYTTRPATLQVYNRLAAAANRHAAAAWPASSGERAFTPFPLAAFDGRLPPVRSGEPAERGPDDRYDGVYTPTVGWPADRVVTPRLDPQATPSQFAYPQGSNWDDILRDELPRLVAFVAITPQGRAAAAEEGLWDLGARFQDTGHELAEALRTLGRTATGGEPVPADEQAALLERVRVAGARHVLEFLDLVIVQQAQNHHLDFVRSAYARLASDGGFGPPVPVASRGRQSRNVAQWSAEVVAGLVRPIVLWVGITGFDLFLELAVLVVWLAIPFWMLDATAPAFRGALRSLGTGMALGPVFLLLLVLWDAAASFILGNLGYQRHAAGLPFVARLVGWVADVATAPQRATIGAVVQTLGTLAVLIVTPRLTRAFFEGTGVAGTVLKAAGATVLAGLELAVAGGSSVAGAARMVAAARAGGATGRQAGASAGSASPSSPAVAAAPEPSVRPMPAGGGRVRRGGTRAARGGGERAGGPVDPGPQPSPVVAVAPERRPEVSRATSKPEAERRRAWLAGVGPWARAAGHVAGALAGPVAGLAGGNLDLAAYWKERGGWEGRVAAWERLRKGPVEAGLRGGRAGSGDSGDG